MNGTRPTPCVCQDLKTSKSLNAIPATRLPPRRLVSALTSSARDRRFLQCRILIAFGRMHSVVRKLLSKFSRYTKTEREVFGRQRTPKDADWVSAGEKGNDRTRA
jgi:hypothetical protein